VRLGWGPCTFDVDGIVWSCSKPSAEWDETRGSICVMNVQKIEAQNYQDRPTVDNCKEWNALYAGSVTELAGQAGLEREPFEVLGPCRPPGGTLVGARFTVNGMPCPAADPLTSSFVDSRAPEPKMCVRCS
jgi:hypothetical protein